MLFHCPSCLIQTHKVEATLINSRHKKQVVRFKDKQLSVSHSFTITDKDGFTLTMLHASMMQKLGCLTEKTPMLLFLIISSSSFDCTWGPQLMFAHIHLGGKQYSSLTEGDAAKAGKVWGKCSKKLNFCVIISKQHCRSSGQAEHKGAGSFSSLLGLLQRCAHSVRLALKSICFCVSPEMALDTLRYFKGRIWRPCNKFLHCTLALRWDQWIPCSWNCFLCPHQMSKLSLKFVLYATHADEGSAVWWTFSYPCFMFK